MDGAPPFHRRGTFPIWSRVIYSEDERKLSPDVLELLKAGQSGTWSETAADTFQLAQPAHHRHAYRNYIQFDVISACPILGFRLSQESTDSGTYDGRREKNENPVVALREDMISDGPQKF